MSSLSDMELLLRADAEQRWLHREVIPVLRQLGALQSLPEDQLEAALVYLQASWSEALARAQASDLARARVSASGYERETVGAQAERYYTAVRALREIIAERVSPYLDEAQADQSGQGLRVTDAREGAHSQVSGLAPRAA